MPQHSILTTDPIPLGLRITWLDRTPDLVDGFDLTIERLYQGADWHTLCSLRWSGYMVDLVEEAQRAVMHAWLYGDQAAVLRAAYTTHRQAKRHARAHERA